MFIINTVSALNTVSGVRMTGEQHAHLSQDFGGEDKYESSTVTCDQLRTI